MTGLFRIGHGEGICLLTNLIRRDSTFIKGSL